MSRWVVLATASIFVCLGALLIFVRDLRFGSSDVPESELAAYETDRRRLILEAALPLIGIVGLLWWAWTAF